MNYLNKIEPVAIEAEIKEVVRAVLNCLLYLFSFNIPKAAASGDKPWERPATWREYSVRSEHGFPPTFHSGILAFRVQILVVD